MKTLSRTSYNEFAGDIMCTTCHRRHSRASITQKTYDTAASTVSWSAAAADNSDATLESHSFSVKYFVRPSLSACISLRVTESRLHMCETKIVISIQVTTLQSQVTNTLTHTGTTQYRPIQQTI